MSDYTVIDIDGHVFEQEDIRVRVPKSVLKPGTTFTPPLSCQRMREKDIIWTKL